MSAKKMHDDEVSTDAALVRRLLSAQFPEWAGLEVAAVRSAGTDNALFRLGDDLVVRLPRIHWATGQVEKENRWLPVLGPQLPLAIPTPVALGEPGDGYPWQWSIYRWLEGKNTVLEHMTDPQQTAMDLACFIRALWEIDTAAGPPPGSHNSGRGEPLLQRDGRVREAIHALQDTYDPASITAIWESALDAPPWNKPPLWIHGDLQAGNLLAVDGELSAVIDFGCLGVGDPAVDIMTAWLYLTEDTRAVFRASLPIDDAAWTRARGWALSFGLIALPYYRRTNPTLAGIARRAIDETLVDWQSQN
jgi:aminoglycoside phosphotransferase (APT) family kinase protein